ncbi:formate-dependent phosphoribosylglycinamide formyltransferase [Corynebacterium ciconiae]|uniref:formate-dependent phosphoribosylglycinamide formyltransferase n=1 Tax=Corynebacterium ciconiae TaxID=227319 RepID=UPI00037660BC|nr:formate-dependent phosphoribosylglycinamide formyltransferase [Corynebacterium ciconiae]
MYSQDWIGTALSETATKVMLLGAGELCKEVAIAFQRLGVEVHAVDRYPNAPAHQVAHATYVLDVRDGEALYDLVTQVRPDYVVPETEHVDSATLERIEAEGISTVVPSTHATTMTNSREAIKNLAAFELGVPTCRFAFASGLEELRQAVLNVGLPCVVKPNQGTAARGQTLVREMADVEQAWDNALEAIDGGPAHVIAEEFVDFDYEVTILTVRSKDPHSDSEATWFCEPIGHTRLGELADSRSAADSEDAAGDFLESWQPAPMSDSTRDIARSIAARVTNALSGRGVFGVELFVKGEDVYFSEVAPRPHDTGMVTMATQRFSEFELHARAVMGFPVDVTLTSPGAAAVINGATEGHALRYTGIYEAMSVPEVDLRLFGKADSYPGRRLGVALATAETIDEAREHARHAAASVTPVAGDE